MPEPRPCDAADLDVGAATRDRSHGRTWWADAENLLSDLLERAESDQRLSRYGTSATTVFLRKSNAPFTSNAV